MIRNEQTEPKRKLWETRRRTRVRRVAKFVYSKKRLKFHKNRSFGFYTLILYILDRCFSVSKGVLFFSCDPDFFYILSNIPLIFHYNSHTFYPLTNEKKGVSIYVVNCNNERRITMNKQKNFIRMIKTNKVFTECVAEKLGISAEMFLRKLSSPMMFTLGELTVLKQVFHLTSGETLYFFAPQVAYRN